ncbi:CHAT domain-containing protein [Streptomyces triticirhizae]|uniref:CHAT domain-containing protein n=1 Tax=Streptomyces triticirhizae TaxID=2483353 RepID=A0A3M2M5Q1_9ACTN|nr:CHAT domain-containing protein [Streptomyces triticirhizae]RMI44153.1 CHAT domain-containing protein [Streptomyces triticirhizae]
MGWLWDAVASPVLDRLKDPDGPGPPRVWWVPTGPLASLPLHAAGHHDGTGASLPERAVSSYTPGLRSLAAAARGAPTGPRRPLVVALSETPGAGRLGHAAAESATLRRLFPDAVELSDAEATRERVLALLPHHSWAHFACHGVIDPDIPSRSGLLLADHGRRPLTMADISELDLGRPELAYLSACETAHTGPRHADEALHLASAFQLAGYRNVVATLWRVPDAAARRFVEGVYAELAATSRPDAPLDVAGAVRRTLLTARAEYPHLPQLWASFVHLGG